MNVKLNIEYKPIYCPQCKRRVANRTNIQKINVVANCMNCNKKVIYDVSSKTTRIVETNLRSSSSGLRF